MYHFRHGNRACLRYRELLRPAPGINVRIQSLRRGAGRYQRTHRKILYPHAQIHVTGYEKTGFSNDFFDLAIGNVPFGQYQVNDPEYNKLGFSIHNYFLAKSLDKVRPGAILAFVTSRYTMDSRDTDAREYLAKRADLLGAIRLPNNAFIIRQA